MSLKKYISIMSLSCLALTANAELVNTDWHTAGDQKATLHVESGLEFLDMSYTYGMGVDEVKSSISSGGSLEGWRFATADEVNFMFESEYNSNLRYGFSSTSHKADFYLKAQEIESKMGGTYTGYTSSQSSYQYYTRGFLFDDEGVLTTKGQVRSNCGKCSKNYQVNFTSTYSDYNKMGAWLVSDGGLTLSSINDPSLNANNVNAPINNVPLPASAGLVLLAMAGFSLRSKKETR